MEQVVIGTIGIVGIPKDYLIEPQRDVGSVHWIEA